MHRPVLAIAIVLGLICSSAVAFAGPRRAASLPEIVEAPQGPEGIGCYWERGRQYCSRYCYVEVDGRRYCRERARDAHAQAPIGETIILPYSSMK